MRPFHLSGCVLVGLAGGFANHLPVPDELVPIDFASFVNRHVGLPILLQSPRNFFRYVLRNPSESIATPFLPSSSFIQARTTRTNGRKVGALGAAVDLVVTGFLPKHLIAVRSSAPTKFNSRQHTRRQRDLRLGNQQAREHRRALKPRSQHSRSRHPLDELHERTPGFGHVSLRQ